MIIHTLKETIEIDIKGEKTILELLQKQGIYLSALCGGRANCGKCKIRLLRGCLPITEEDKKHFQKGELAQGFRLACKARPSQDLEIKIFSEEEGFSIVSDFDMKKKNIRPGYAIININLKDEDWEKTPDLSSAIKAKVKLKVGQTPTLTYRALRSLSRIIHESPNSKIDSLEVLLRDNTILDIYANAKGKPYGIAIDIGTTTLAFALIDLKEGKVKDTYSKLNSQGLYGADIVSRIQGAEGEGLEKLHSLIKDDILTAIEELLKKAKVKGEDIYGLVMTGNTVMLHLAQGLSPKSLGQFPFTAIKLALHELSFEELFREKLLDCRVSILPSIGAFIGADVLAGILYHNIIESDEIVILIDIGTNGEIVIGNKDRILASSTAAGPALEGGNISCGIGSVPGAIGRVTYKDNNFQWETIENREPVGICGSGVIDSIGEGLRHGLIDNTGLLRKDLIEDGLTIYTDNKGKKLRIGQRDIREIQLAKGAIRAGIECLIGEYAIDYSDIDRLYLAGGFGSNIRVENIVEMGLIPESLGEKAVVSGNSSLGGGVNYLLDKSSKDKLEIIRQKSKAINLSRDSRFNDFFIRYMYF